MGDASLEQREQPWTMRREERNRVVSAALIQEQTQNWRQKRGNWTRPSRGRDAVEEWHGGNNKQTRRGKKPTRGCVQKQWGMARRFKQGRPSSSWSPTGPSNGARERKACGMQPVTETVTQRSVHRPRSQNIFYFPPPQGYRIF